MSKKLAGSSPAAGSGRSHLSRAVVVLVQLVVWFVVATIVGVTLFVSSDRSLVLASHDASVRPTFTGEVVLRTGPVLPDVRFDSGHSIGLDIQLGKTEALSTGQLFDRYAVIASQPAGQILKAKEVVREMAYAAGLRGAVFGLVPGAIWLLLGRSRRRELGRRAASRSGIAVVTGLAVVGVLVWQPWQQQEPQVDDAPVWTSLGDFLGPGVDLPEEAEGLEVRTDAVTTVESKKLVRSAIDTYDRARKFYTDTVEAAEDLVLREPEEGETVAILVSDRHDNVGMDPVARAIADQAGATVVLDAGDDTSTGNPWESFSLDSVDAAFEGFAQYSVAGNHDHGPFVSDYLANLGWTTLDGEVVDGPGDSLILGVNDPRSSGLGTWRNETGLSFSEQSELIADAACESQERVNTLLVHDANSGQPALDRGCVDLVVGGHLHVSVGPTRVVGDSGEVGYSYTNGTTGGAAYAIAVGSKLRRAAAVALITYRDGEPAGIQEVLLQTNGVFEVGEYIDLNLERSILPGPVR